MQWHARCPSHFTIDSPPQIQSVGNHVFSPVQSSTAHSTHSTAPGKPDPRPNDMIKINMEKRREC